MPRPTEHQLQNFLGGTDLAHWYRSYSYKRDSLRSGFPDIRDLEQRLIVAAREGAISEEDLKAVARWGSPRNASRVKAPFGSIDLSLYRDGSPNARVVADPLAPLAQLKIKTKQLGPTLLTKVLRFALPSLYAVLDTELVAVFGKESRQEHLWLDLVVSDYGSGPLIRDTQPGWPSEYGSWLTIVRDICGLLNSEAVNCPHPPGFVASGLRQDGVWFPADVEMALFSYASTSLG